MGYFFLGDKIRFHTKITLVLALISVLLTFCPQLFLKVKSEGRASTFGDMIAVGTGISTSAYITIVRAAEKQNPKIYLLPSTVIGGLASSLIVVLVLVSNNNARFMISPDDSKDTSLAYLYIFGDALCVSIIYVSLTYSSKHVPGAEVSLITLLESVLGPLMVFIVFGETPGPFTLAGGGLLLISLACHEIAAMKLMNQEINKINVDPDDDYDPLKRSIDEHPRGSVEGVLATLEKTKTKRLKSMDVQASEEEQTSEKRGSRNSLLGTLTKSFSSKEGAPQAQEDEPISIHEHPRGSVEGILATKDKS
jgi:hypothetical protein